MQQQLRLCAASSTTTARPDTHAIWDVTMHHKKPNSRETNCFLTTDLLAVICPHLSTDHVVGAAVATIVPTACIVVAVVAIQVSLVPWQSAR